MLALLAALAMDMLSVDAFLRLNRLRVRLRPFLPMPPPPALSSSSWTAANMASSGGVPGPMVEDEVDDMGVVPKTFRMRGLALEPGVAALPLPLLTC